nr:hypothetical protein [Tanacetum cinerariifolium]
MALFRSIFLRSYKSLQQLGNGAWVLLGREIKVVGEMWEVVKRSRKWGRGGYKRGTLSESPYGCVSLRSDRNNP